MAVAEIAVTAALSALAGFFAGALSRQPEINDLKQQIKILQGEVGRLQKLVLTQDQQIHELMDAYKELNYRQKMQERERIRGSIIFQYAFKEYLEILLDANETGRVNLSKKDVKFYNAFGKIIGRAEISDKNRQIVMDYILEKYRKNINRFEEPDLSTLIENNFSEAH